jgi:hypothetical protein
MQRYIGTKTIHAEPLGLVGDDDRVTPGYKVVYDDGYESWSPADVFEAAYRPCSAMTFGLALEALKIGHRVARSGWNGKGMWLEMQVPDSHSKMTLPYVFLNYPEDAEKTPGARVPWLASQTDMLSEDWSAL